MRTRWLLAVGGVLLAAPVALAQPPKPNLVVQFKPLDEWLADAKVVVNVLGTMALPTGAPALPPGTTEYSFQVGPGGTVGAGGGIIAPGSLVDVILVEKIVDGKAKGDRIVEKVLVVGTKHGRAAPGQAPPPDSVTIAATPQQTATMEAAAKKGKFAVALVKPGDDAKRPAPPAPAGPAGGDKMIEDGIASVLGKDWRKAIDTTVPWGGYAVFQPKLEDSTFVGMLPVKDAKEVQKIQAANGIKSEEKDGVYTLQMPSSPTPVFARFDGGYYYIATSAAALAKDNLLKPGDVFAAKETASLTLRLRIDSLPKELKDAVAAQWDAAMEQALANQPDASKPIARASMEGVKRFLTEGREITVGLDFDRKAGDLAIVSEVIAMPGTPLAKSHREAKPTVSRFAALAADAAAFVGYTVPMTFEAAAGAEFDKLVTDAHKSLTAELGARVEKEQVEKLVRALTAFADAGVMDVAIAFYAGKDGTGTLVGAVRIKDAARAETALKDVLGGLPPEYRDRITFNAGKIGTANVHRIDVGKDAPEDFRKMFGGTASVVIAGDAAVVALGADAEKRIQTVLEARPKPSPMMVVEVSLAKLWPLLESVAKTDEDRAEMKQVRALLGKDVDRIRLFHLTRTTGDTVKYRAGIDLMPILKAAATVGARQSMMPPLPPVEPKK